MLKKIIIAVIVCILTFLFFAQYNPWVQRTLTASLCAKLEDVLDCDIIYSPHSINFFSPEIVLDNLVVCPRNKIEWQWSCARYISGFSWWHVIKHGFLDLYVRVDECRAQSTIHNGKLAMLPYIKALLEAPVLPIPLELKTIKLNKAECTITDVQQKIHAKIVFNIESKNSDNTFKTAVYITDAQCTIQDRLLVSGMTANIESVMHAARKQKTTVRVNGNIEMPQLDNGTCFLTGIWENGHGRFSLRHMQQVLSIDPIIISQHDDGTPSIQAKARVPLSYLWRILTNDVETQKVTGTSLLQIRGSFGSQKKIDGQLIFQDVYYDNYGLGSTYKISFNQRNNHTKGAVHIRAQSADVSGNWQWDFDTHVGNLFLRNNGDITIPHARYWHIPSRGFNVAIKRKKNGEITGSYNCDAINRVRNTTNKTHGSLEIGNNIFRMHGAINDCHYSGNGTIKPNICVRNLSYKDHAGNRLFNVSGNVHKNIGASLFSSAKKRQKLMEAKGTIAYPFIRSLVNNIMRYDVQGEGAVALNWQLYNDKMHVDMRLDEGTIRLPKTYNFIQGFDMHGDWYFNKNTFVARNMHCLLHNGCIDSKRAIIQLDQNNALDYAYVPLQVKRCLFNVRRDLFAIISGDLLLSKKKHSMPKLSGTIIFDRAQLKENIFSSDFQKKFFTETGTLFSSDSDMLLDVAIKTNYPIRIDTALLEANAVVNMTIGNRVSNPSITGSIRLLSGNILFPYKPLQITKGAVYFLPGQLYNPTIELIAKNNIKKYSVTLLVNGLLQDYHVVLDASPPLTEEQILALLLVGSHEDSLNILMPALIVQNIKTALFGSEYASLLKKYMKRANTPFHINLVPSFTDQTGRGGLRGGIEITVNDCWRALIQKNFSLSEDTRFELEYRLSDDIGIRAIRDERCDIGGEIEMRWKF